ncbi:hypothetical protein FOA52_001280 [Chlamydomonas sp. UWO 241]|nr:hypothetical protein FOA52_001280 [Chlamydomonas sp. UWO 241]
MKSYAGSAAMEATLQLLQEMIMYSTSGCELINPQFKSGACAMTISIDALMKVMQMNSPFRDFVGKMRQPGSTRVLNRQTGRLEECTRERCPYATLERTYDGSEVLVNHAPYSVGFFGFINVHQDLVYQQAMYDFFSFMSEPMHSKARVIHSLAIEPFRKSHLNTTDASLTEWKDAGYNPSAVKELLDIMQRDIAHPNFVVNLRMLGGSSFLKGMWLAIHNASVGMAPAMIASALAADYDAIMARSGPIDDLRASLWRGLGIPVPSPPRPPAPPMVPILRGGNTGGVHHVGVIIGVTLGGIMLLLLMFAAAFFLVRRSKHPLFGRYWIPAAGDDTTLVVTDIMDSTALWETLDAFRMSCAIATHHSVVRKALAHFHGYEQATEGDSFLLAFHTPIDALGFAVQLQAGLLAADWEPELLAHPSCAPVAMVQSAALVHAGGGDERFHLRFAAAALLGEGSRSGRHTHGTAIASLTDAFSSTGMDGMFTSDPIGLFRASSDAGAGLVSRLFNAEGLMAPPSNQFLARCHLGSMGGVAAHAVDGGPAEPVSPINGAGCNTLGGGGGVGDSGSAFPSSDQSRMCTGSEAPGAPNIRGTATMAEHMKQAFVETDARAPKDEDPASVIVFRGLRVRVGMHSGVSKMDVERNSTAGRTFFTGMPLALAKAVGDAGAGGMVLMTQDTFERMNPARELSGVLVLCLGGHQVKDDSLRPVCLYQAIEQPLVPRLAAFEALHGVEKLQLSVLDAPVGNNVTVAFINMVGMSTLQACNMDQAARCGQQLSLLATEVGWRPLSTDWLRQAARFWAKALRRPDGDLLKAAMRESWELAAGGVRESWVAQLSECLSTVGHTLVWGQEAGGIARLLETAAADHDTRTL